MEPVLSRDPRTGESRAQVAVAADTATVDAATKGLGDKAANDKRKATMTQLEQQCEAVAPDLHRISGPG